MRKLVGILLSLSLLVSVAGCSNGNENSEGLDNDGTKKESEISATEKKVESVTFEADNAYMQISSIDISACVYENGYFSGELSYIQKTTEQYVEAYDDYFFRQIYFGFYNEKGNLVGEEIAQNNHIYSREYTSEENTYVMVSSKNPIKEVKVTKIVCEKPAPKE